MYNKTIKYVDFFGNERTEVLHFNFTRAELVEMENSKEEGLKAVLEKIIHEQDKKKLIKYFKKIILSAYGKPSEDGRMFIKNDQLREEFVQTAAYSELFMELSSNDMAAIEFVKGIIPVKIDSPNSTQEPGYTDGRPMPLQRNSRDQQETQSSYGIPQIGHIPPVEEYRQVYPSNAGNFNTAK